MNTKTPRHVMIDLETMGRTPEQPIVSIGAVIFDPRYGVITDETFYWELHWKSQGRNADPDTVTWWASQSAEARAVLDGIDDLQDALEALSEWLPKDCRVWGNGSIFDIATLEHAYRQYKIEIPWKFWNVYDCRTVLALYEAKRGGLDRSKSNHGTAHNALDDAIFQAKWVTVCWSDLQSNEAAPEKRSTGRLRPVR